MTEQIPKVETRKKIHSAVVELFKSSLISKPSVSTCNAQCYVEYAKHNNTALLNECLDECKAIQAIVALAERLHIELVDTIIDVIWRGGNIDPSPFEKTVRKGFSYPPIERQR